MGEAPHEHSQTAELERLFHSWRKLIQLETKNRKQNESSAPNESESNSPPIDPWVLVDTAKRIPAKTLKDLLFKLAFWRWSNPDLGPTFDKLKNGDAMIYSAFRDLVDLTQEKTVMTPFDKETNLMRGGKHHTR